MRNNRLSRLTVMALAGLLLAGCSPRQADTPPASTADAAAAAAAASVAHANTRAERDLPFVVKELQVAVEGYEKIRGQKPDSLEQMVRQGFLPALPAPPPGRRFTYDSATGRVGLAP